MSRYSAYWQMMRTCCWYQIEGFAWLMVAQILVRPPFECKGPTQPVTPSDVRGNMVTGDDLAQAPPHFSFSFL